MHFGALIIRFGAITPRSGAIIIRFGAINYFTTLE
jgi:hypothetical protein